MVECNSKPFDFVFLELGPIGFRKSKNFERVQVVSRVPQKNYNQFEKKIAAHLA